MTQEALKLAFEALKTFHYAMIDAGVLDRQEVLNQGFTAATAIKEALAQEQEPVEWPRTMERGALIQWLHLEMAQHNLDEGTIEKLLEDAESLAQPEQPAPVQQDWKKLSPEEPPLVKWANEQPAQQEPVTDKENEKFSRDVSNFKGTDEAATMYALEKFLKGRMAPEPAQRTWVGLTHQQAKFVVQAWDGNDAYVLCRAIEAKLKELNT